MASKESTHINVLDKIKDKVEKPELYKVILLNDDYTPMDFVVEVLRHVFHKKKEEATKVMIEVHKKGRGLAGVFIYDIALTKTLQVEVLAIKDEYPLKCVLEKV